MQTQKKKKKKRGQSKRWTARTPQRSYCPFFFQCLHVVFFPILPKRWKCINDKACKALHMLQRNAKHFPIEAKQLLHLAHSYSLRPVVKKGCKKDVKKVARNLVTGFFLNNYTWQFSMSIAKENWGGKQFNYAGKCVQITDVS